MDHDFTNPLKLTYADLKKMGIVGSRPHLKEMIKRGSIRKPHKDGATRQARAWWYWDEVMQDIEDERQRLNAMAPYASVRAPSSRR
jgi:hypothetical protein